MFNVGVTKKLMRWTAKCQVYAQSFHLRTWYKRKMHAVDWKNVCVCILRAASTRCKRKTHKWTEKMSVHAQQCSCFHTVQEKNAHNTGTL